MGKNTDKSIDYAARGMWMRVFLRLMFLGVGAAFLVMVITLRSEGMDSFTMGIILAEYMLALMLSMHLMANTFSKMTARKIWWALMLAMGLGITIFGAMTKAFGQTDKIPLGVSVIYVALIWITSPRRRKEKKGNN